MKYLLPLLAFFLVAAAPYHKTVNVTDSHNHIIGGSMAAALPNETVRIVDGSGNVVNSFGLTAGEAILDALTATIHGNVWWVDGANGNDSNTCLSPSQACATIGKAITKTTDMAGDVIEILPGSYAENLTISNSGVTLTAANGVATAVGVSTSIAPVTGIPLTINGSAVATHINGLYLYSQDTSPALYLNGTSFTGTNPISLECGACILVENSQIVASFSPGTGDAIKVLAGANGFGSILFKDSQIADGQYGVDMIAAAGNTGPIYGLYFDHDIFTSDVANPTSDFFANGVNGNNIIQGLYVFNSYFENKDRPNYFDISANANNTNFLIDDVFNLTTPILPAMLKAGGLSLLRTYPAGDITGATVQAKSFTSSTITTSPATAFTEGSVLPNSSLVCSDIILETDGTGLAGGTNFTITTNNVNGRTTLCSETVANLGANKTVKCSAASVTGLIPFTLETGKNLQIQCTGANCTGTGTVTILPICLGGSAYAVAN